MLVSFQHIFWGHKCLSLGLFFEIKIKRQDSADFSQILVNSVRDQARKLQATLVRNYHRLTDLLTGVKCRPTSVGKEK